MSDEVSSSSRERILVFSPRRREIELSKVNVTEYVGEKKKKKKEEDESLCMSNYVT